MAKFTGKVNFATVRHLTDGGVYGWMDNAKLYGDSLDEIASRLERQYGGPDGLDYDTAYYIANQFTQIRDSGAAINRRRSDTTADSNNLPLVTGCEGNYRYTVVIDFARPGESASRSFPFLVNSSTPLGKLSILSEAQGMADEMVVDNDTVLGGAGSDIQWQQKGKGRVTEAAQCTEF